MMTGDYTKVPLRPDERWTAAPMQQARVLLDHEWNLNLAANARARADEILDVIGLAGVAQGSPAFQVLSVAKTGPGGSPDVSFGAGHMWVGGMEPYAPAPFTYSSQDQVPALPQEGSAFAYLDVFPEHVQPAEDPELVDPALAPIDSAARARVGWRARVVRTKATTCGQALAELGLLPVSAATARIFRTGPPAAADPCAPPGDPLGQLPDGLFRLEVLDSGDPATARLAWAFDDGASAVAVASMSGLEVTLAPSLSVKFAVGDLIELSWLARREDRLDHGPLYRVTTVAAGAGGDVLTLDGPVRAPQGALGLCARRWHGSVVGAAAATPAMLGDADLGVRFSVAGTRLLPGDWWGSRLRQSAAEPVEVRTDVAPDGIRHAFCPLSLFDLASVGEVTSDCRPMFGPLVGRKDGMGVCTVVAQPGDDLQAAFDSLPADGGEVCLAAGLYPLRQPVVVRHRQRVVVTGVGPAAVVRAIGIEAALVFDHCSSIEVRSVRIEGGSPRPPGEKHLNGALSFLACVDVRVTSCELSCPTGPGPTQACLTVRAGDDGARPDRVTVSDNDLEVGAWQIGMLLLDSGTVLVFRNHVRVPAPEAVRFVPRNPLFLANLQRVLAVVASAAPAPAPAAPTPAPAPAPAAPAGPATPDATRRERPLPAGSEDDQATVEVKGGDVGAPAAQAASPADAAATADEPAEITAASGAAGGGAVAGGARDHVLTNDRLRGVVDSLTHFAIAKRLTLAGNEAAVSLRFVRSIAGTKVAALGPAERAAVVHLATVLTPGSQGIVIGGDDVATVQVLDNLVEGVIRGVHIGTSNAKKSPGKGPHQSIGEVMVARNIVHLRVPYLHHRDRHAIYVGNAGSVHVLDTVATLERPDAPVFTANLSAILPTPVEAVRLFGHYGAFVCVRQTSASGFADGVRFTPLGVVPRLHMWLVAETMATGGVTGVNVCTAQGNPLSPSPIVSERNIP
jgi:hypothetical protein